MAKKKIKTEESAKAKEKTKVEEKVTVNGEEPKTDTKKEEAPVEEEKPNLEEQIAEIKDKYVRLSAEFDNYRKRTLKEKMELTKSAGEAIIGNILPVIDDFERGMQSMNNAKEIDSIKEGITLIYNKFQEFLKQNGVKEIDAIKQEFDVDKHEAITKIPAPEDKLKGKIVDVIEKGYLLNDKVLRYSKVVVGE